MIDFRFHWFRYQLIFSWVARNWSDVSEWTADTALAVLQKDLKATYEESINNNLEMPFNALSSIQLFHSMGKEKK